MRSFRLLSHQPLAVWSLLLIILVSLTIVGSVSGNPSAAPTTTAPTSPVDPQDLLETISTMHASVADQTFDRWLRDFTALAQRGRETSDRANLELWQGVVDAAEHLADPDVDTPTELLAGRQRLVTAVFTLKRESTP